LAVRRDAVGRFDGRPQSSGASFLVADKTEAGPAETVGKLERGARNFRPAALAGRARFAAAL
jgi:hypothetical protein